MPSLFDEVDPEFAKHKKISNALVFKKKSKKSELSKEQKKFNKYVKAIERLTKQNAEMLTKAETYAQLYYSDVFPVKRALNLQNFELGKLLFQKAESVKLSKAKKYELTMILKFFFDRYTEVVEELSEEDKAIYSEWSGRDYDDFHEEKREDLLLEMEENLFDNFGINVDLIELFENSESEIEFQLKLKELLDDTAREFVENDSKQRKNKKSSKKDRDKEEVLKKELELKETSMKSIYKTLVMAVHPDKEIDESRKEEKHTLMKEVTKAYKNKDLKRLLQLEIEVLNKENDHIEQLSEEKLAAYNATLKEQVDELELEKEMMFMNPRFAVISQLIPYPEEMAIKFIKDNVSGAIEYKADFEEVYNALNASNTKAKINQAIKAIIDLLPEDALLEYDDDLIEMMDELDFYD
jgi:hypothetical protein